MDVEIFENDIDLYLHLFQEEHDVPDLRAASQSVWNACLMYICRRVFKGTDKLKQKQLVRNDSFTGATNYNAYNYELVNQVCDYYIALCLLYDKEVSLIGFGNLTGIGMETLQSWGDGVIKSSATSQAIYKKIISFREESLSNKLATGNKNPVGILAILNRHYAWNLPGVSRENNNNAKLTAADLPKLGQLQPGKAQEIPENVAE